MKDLFYAMGAIGSASRFADCRNQPIVTLTFESRSDRYRFESQLRNNIDPILAVEMFRGLEPGTFRIEGVLLKLAVRQVDAT